MRLYRTIFRPPILLAAALTFGGVACKPATPKPPVVGPANPGLPPVPVSDQDFAGTVHRLLRQGGQSQERSALLAGAVQRQLQHAASEFAAKRPEEATRAVVGALYLMRTGEMRVDVFQPEATAALKGAIAEFSKRGDTGRSLALMLMRQALTSTKGRPTEDAHLTALRRYIKDTRTGGDMQKMSDDVRLLVGQALLDRRPETRDAAMKALNVWVGRAIKYNMAFVEHEILPPREEGIEASHALDIGAVLAASLYLNSGDAKGAVAGLESGEMGRIVPSGLFIKLRRAADGDAAEDWRGLTRDYAQLAFSGTERPDDTELLHAAVWGLAVESYRRDPTSQAVAHLLAEELAMLGMPEVAPLVLGDALGPEPTVASLSGALDRFGSLLRNQFREGNPSTARRIFAAGHAIFAVADQKKFRGRTRPSTAKLRHLMASIELHAGNTKAARPLIEAALQQEPTVWGYTMLGRIERQLGLFDSALAHATRAPGLPDAKIAPLRVAESHLLAFDVLHRKNDSVRARAELAKAKAVVDRTRSQGLRLRQRVDIEVISARIADRMGDAAAADRAFELAIENAASNRAMLSSVVLEQVARGLVTRRVRAARRALQVGIEANLDQADMVYGAIWLSFLEQLEKNGADGKASRILEEAAVGPDWTNSLARWAVGRLTNDQLRKAARDNGERVEADFYIAMREYVSSGGTKQEGLKPVATNALIDLVEVRIARDLIAPYAIGGKAAVTKAAAP